MKKIILFTIMISLGFLNVVVANAKESSSYQVPRSVVHEIKSEALGRSYELFVKLPRGYELEEMRVKNIL